MADAVERWRKNLSWWQKTGMTCLEGEAHQDCLNIMRPECLSDTLDGNVAIPWCWISGLQNHEIIIPGFNSPWATTCVHRFKMLTGWDFVKSVQEMNTASSPLLTGCPSKTKNLKQALNLQNVETNKRHLYCADKLPWLFKKKLNTVK